MPVLKTTSPGRLTFAPKLVPSRRWPSLRTSVAWTGASQGLDGPPSTPSMRDLCFAGVRAALRLRRGRRVASGGARAERGRPRRRARGRSAARAASGRAGFKDAGAARAARIPLITKLVRRAAAGRARVEHGSGSAGLHSSRRALRLRPRRRSLSCGASGVVSQPVAHAARELRNCGFSGCQRDHRRSPAQSCCTNADTIGPRASSLSMPLNE